MAEKHNTPEIRFEGFTDPWEQRKLGELMDVASVRRVRQEDWTNVGVRFLRARDLVAFAKNEAIEDPLFISDEMYREYSAQSGKVVVGDLLVTGVGTIGVPWLVTSENPVYFKDGNIIWFKNQNTIDGEFFYHSFTAHAIQSYIKEAAGIGTVGTYTIETGKKTPIWLPLEREQRQIAAFMTFLNTLITLHQRKYDKLCTVKKSMLDKMFPKPGETEPEIRFEGFTDPWEQRKLSSIAASFDYGLNAAATEYDGKNKYLRITDIDDATHEFLKSDLTTPLADLAMSADYLLEEGDLLFARTGASVGKTYLYRQYDGTVYFAGFLIRARIEESADPEFVYQATLTDAYKKFVAITSQRSGQPGVNAQEYADYQLMLPSRTEQQQIGMTLRSLDNLITLHQRKLDLLKNMKKSLLDKMFV